MNASDQPAAPKPEGDELRETSPVDESHEHSEPASSDEPRAEEARAEETGAGKAGAEEGAGLGELEQGDDPVEAKDVEASDAEEEEEDEEEEEVAPLSIDLDPLEESSGEDASDAEMDWYILKVQSNRENSICDGLRRRVAVAGLDRFFGEVLVPTEDVAEFKNGKRRVVKRKLYPGYIVVHMAINEETWFLVRETPGIGDFTGAAGKPTPMLPHEVDRIVKAIRPEEDGGEPIKTAIPFKPGDRVRIKEGTFENFEGDVELIDEANGRVTVIINIFGRSTPVELEHWQIESV